MTVILATTSQRIICTVLENQYVHNIYYILYFKTWEQVIIKLSQYKILMGK